MTSRTLDSKITERQIKAGSYRINLLEAGEGPLVLCLHGFPETSWSWRRQLPVLADAGYHAVAIDLLGYGRSSKPTRIDEYRISNVIAIIADVIAALGAERAVLVGHDWGAAIAWCVAWARPDITTGIMSLGIPFGGRGLWGLPTSPFGERRPSELYREIAGPDAVFYQEYFHLPGLAEEDFDVDPRSWLRNQYYSFSASLPLPEGVQLPNPAELDAHPEYIIPIVRGTGLVQQPGARPSDGFAPAPDRMPEWLPEEDLDAYVAAFEYTGLTGALNYYRCSDLNWELLGAYEDRKVDVPAYLVLADRDAPTLWAREAINRMTERVPDLRGITVLENCGHWIQKEQRAQLEVELLRFVREIEPVSQPVAVNA